VGAFFFVYQSAFRIQALLLLPLKYLHRVNQHLVRLEHTLINQHVVHLQLIRNLRNGYTSLTQLLDFSRHITPLAYYREVQSR